MRYNTHTAVQTNNIVFSPSLTPGKGTLKYSALGTESEHGEMGEVIDSSRVFTVFSYVAVVPVGFLMLQVCICNEKAQTLARSFDVLGPSFGLLSML